MWSGKQAWAGNFGTTTILGHFSFLFFLKRAGLVKKMEKRKRKTFFIRSWMRLSRMNLGLLFHEIYLGHFVLNLDANRSTPSFPNSVTIFLNASSDKDYSFSGCNRRDSRSSSTLSSDLMYEAWVQCFLCSRHFQMSFAIFCNFGKRTTHGEK